jgi:tetratricopeptide (TPR) repeat protein
MAALYLALAPSRDVGSPDTQLSIAERAAEVARALGNDRLLATAGVRRGLLLMVMGRPEAARAALEDVLPLVDQAADYSTRNLALGVHSELLKLAGAFAACRDQRENMVVLAYAVGDPVWRVTARAQLGEICVLMGAWGEARTVLEAAMELGRGVLDPHVTAFALTGLGELCLAEGRLDEASHHLHVCLTAVQAANYGHWMRIVQRLLAQLDLLAGRPRDATERVRSVAREEGEEHAGTIAVLARAALESGEVTEGAETSRRAVDLARSHDNRLDLCEALLARGQAAIATSDVGEAVLSLGEALTLARTMPYPYAEGRILYQWGLSLLGTAPEEARQRLETALQIFRRLGARWYAERTEQALRALEQSIRDEG